MGVISGFRGGLNLLWEGVKAVAGILAAIYGLSWVQIILYGFAFFYFLSEAYEGWGEESVLFAIDAAFCVLTLVILVVEVRDAYRRWTR